MALRTQRVLVTLANGTELDLEVANPDMVRWDMTSAKHGWPAMDKAPMLWATFVAWRAAVRTGVYSGSWEDWSNRDALGVQILTADGREATEEDVAAGLVGTEVDPTQPGPEPDSV